MNLARSAIAGITGLVALVLLTGCPVTAPYEYVAGKTGEGAQLGNVASVQVLSPAADVAIAGGTPLEVSWLVVATTRFAVVDVIFDADQDPNNGNEVFAEQSLPFDETSAVLDTTELEAGSYFIGVVLVERNEIAAFDYAAGRVTVNQRTQLYFTSPRDNFAFDRTQLVAPRFDVAWTLYDPDSTVRTQIFLDPDDTPNGNEFLLRESDSQTGDSFSFNLPTAMFEPGVYRILAIVDDGVNTADFYAPASIRLRSRLAGHIDLRDMHLPETGIDGAVFEGFNPRDNAGSFVTTVPDLDGDGLAEFFILAQFGKPAYVVNVQRTGIGEGYLIFGRRDHFSGVYNLNATGTLFRGDVFGGVPEVSDPIRPSRGITSFTVLTDWEGDGVRELAFGIPFTDSVSVSFLDPGGYFRSGAVVIVPGSTLGAFAGQTVYNLAYFGTRVIPTSDNCDPQSCLYGFIGPKAPGIDWFNYEHAAIVPPDWLGCRISTSSFGDQCGETISTYPFYAGRRWTLTDQGEMSGLLISVPGRDPATSTGVGTSIPGAGVVSLYFPPRGFNPWNVEDELLPHRGPFHYLLDDLVWSPGFVVDRDCSPDPCLADFNEWLPWERRTARFYGGFAGGGLGGAVAVEDVNTDGLADILIGSPLSHDGAGATFLIFGRLPELVVGSELAVEELGLPMQGPDDPQGVRVFDGIRIVGAAGSRLGQSQDAAGDFNSDGIGDVVIGSPLVNNRQGGAAVFFGSRDVINLTQEEIPFDEIPQRGLGVIFRGQEEGDYAGARVARAGDVDGDGNDDILIAAPYRSVQLDTDLDGTLEIDRTQCGVVYLIYGSPDLRGTYDLADVGTERLPGAVFIGRNSGDHLGAGLGEQGDRSRGIAGSGDIDGDGRADLLLSSVRAAPRDRTRAGEVYLLYGKGD